MADTFLAACINCTTAGLECAFTRQQQASRETSNFRFVSSVASPATAATLSPLGIRVSSVKPTINFLHIELFNHFTNDDTHLFYLGETEKLSHTQVVKSALGSPYLSMSKPLYNSSHFPWKFRELGADNWPRNFLFGPGSS